MKKRFAIPAVVLLAAVAGGVWLAKHHPASPFEAAEKSAAAPDLVARGEYVARASDCVACHSLPDGAPFSGGLEMATPMGSIFATNITPDPETGIGAYSLADFDRAVRSGVTPDGRRLYPAMPYPSYAKLTDEDVRALYTYFMEAVEPANHPNRPSGIDWPMDQRWPLAFWNMMFTEGGVYEASTSEDALWNRGAYLVQSAGHCGSCHTPRGPAMEERALDESSPLYLSGALLDGWYAPSLRNDPNTGIGRWSEADVVAFLKEGRNAHAVVFGSMADAFNNSTQFLTDEDLRAIAHYLKSLPGDPERDGSPWEYDPASAAALAPARRAEVPGAQTYATKCAYCHGADGRGRAPWIPPLAGAVSALAPEDASAINVTLNGSARVVAGGVPDAYRMPPFRAQLSDREIADVLSFIRSAWGNSGGAVAPEAVAELRGPTDPASSQVIVLQMR
ncbi:c-type cytochrome [Amaricoccus solimangrovi]|uniref:C-type cytochrome n=1 Tax=Amaricoccus solimangrovi TaxID=2589815 RepID=A0A501WUH9_9RHOB|nr:cytochrome c [Amaricoccus solimangrovi]TPE51037.1 c-type cytochrome [Amaricoccus solimangrovi]